ncbi:hypothetical protein [Kibdelosporangium philippinense]|uniref:hypothetical protein n=1 Tax=Kibdelosporangium philippinense TaxID=211113 RepID=UPI00361245A4
MLELCAAGEVRCSEKTGWPAGHGLSARRCLRLKGGAGCLCFCGACVAETEEEAREVRLVPKAGPREPARICRCSGRAGSPHAGGGIA